METLDYASRDPNCECNDLNGSDVAARWFSVGGWVFALLFILVPASWHAGTIGRVIYALPITGCIFALLGTVSSAVALINARSNRQRIGAITGFLISGTFLFLAVLFILDVGIS